MKMYLSVLSSYWRKREGMNERVKLLLCTLCGCCGWTEPFLQCLTLHAFSTPIETSIVYFLMFVNSILSFPRLFYFFPLTCPFGVFGVIHNHPIIPPPPSIIIFHPFTATRLFSFYPFMALLCGCVWLCVSLSALYFFSW